jgi:hypothetical protein
MPAGSDITPAATKLLAAVRAREQPATAAVLVDWIAEHHGHGLRRETVSRSLNDRGLVDHIDQGNGIGKLWLTPTTDP